MIDDDDDDDDHCRFVKRIMQDASTALRGLVFPCMRCHQTTRSAVQRKTDAFFHFLPSVHSAISLLFMVQKALITDMLFFYHARN